MTLLKSIDRARPWNHGRLTGVRLFPSLPKALVGSPVEIRQNDLRLSGRAASEACPEAYQTEIASSYGFTKKCLERIERRVREKMQNIFNQSCFALLKSDWNSRVAVCPITV